MIHWKTNGFLQVDGSGIKVEARVYERGAAKVYLFPTAHIGSGRFYEELMRGVPVDRSVLLPEGVSDRTGLLAARWSYAGVAKAAGLREQPDFARNLSGAAVEACDVYMSDFSEETQKALSLIAMSFQFLSEGDRQRATEVLEGWEFGGRLDRKLFRKISHDLIDKRNAKVTASVERVSQKYDHVLVPWGALHMAGIEGGLLKQGFRRIEDREVRMLRWEDFVRGVLKL